MLVSDSPVTEKLQFAQFPMKRSWRDIRASLPSLQGASVVMFIESDYDSWLIFNYNCHEFSINDQDAILTFHVQDSGCPHQILEHVISHFAWLNDSSSLSWLGDARDHQATNLGSRDKSAALVACRPRFFAELPFCKSWAELCDQIVKLEGAQVTTFSKSEAEVWTGFGYAGEQFRLHDRGDTLHLSVEDPTCPDGVILKVLHHFTEVLAAT